MPTIIKSRALDSAPDRGKNVSVFLIAWNDIPRLTLGSFSHFWLHLAVITSIVTKHSVCYILLHPHQNHWCWYVCLMMSINFFSPFQSHCTGKQSNPESHACAKHWLQMLRHILRASFSIWILPFFSLSLAVLFCHRFLFQLYFWSGCGVQFVDKDRLLLSRLSQKFLKQISIFVD